MKIFKDVYDILAYKGNIVDAFLEQFSYLDQEKQRLENLLKHCNDAMYTRYKRQYNKVLKQSKKLAYLYSQTR